MTENCKFRKPYIIGRFYNISQRNFGILPVLGCSFKLWWSFCLDQNLFYNANGPLTDQAGCPWLESDRSAIRFQPSDWPICLFPWRSAFLIDMWGVLIGLAMYKQSDWRIQKISEFFHWLNFLIDHDQFTACALWYASAHSSVYQ